MTRRLACGRVSIRCSWHRKRVFVPTLRWSGAGTPSAATPSRGRRRTPATSRWPRPSNAMRRIVSHHPERRWTASPRRFDRRHRTARRHFAHDLSLEVRLQRGRARAAAAGRAAALPAVRRLAAAGRGLVRRNARPGAAGGRRSSRSRVRRDAGRRHVGHGLSGGGPAAGRAPRRGGRRDRQPRAERDRRLRALGAAWRPQPRCCPGCSPPEPRLCGAAQFG